jgi:hypothetical protein
VIQSKASFPRNNKNTHIQEQKIMTRYLIGIGLIIALFSAFAPGETFPEERKLGFGASFESAKANQILNPEAGKDLEPVEGFDGEAAQITLEKYREDFTRPAPRTIYSINIGGIGRR